ncbi:hypothetical protein Tco_1123661 [Tanacetum coccineum]|uniref:Retrotransposon gag domain-containing protein n=1 Tax=Tanacetum coccineum TaxID=301880 RepID=A0ABQ5J4J0_9ASTR
MKEGKIELKSQFLIELGKNAFSETNGEDAVKHIEIFLEVIDLIKVPKVRNNQIRVRVFPFSLTSAARKWWEDESIGLITKWVDLTEKKFMKFYPPSRTGKKIEAKNNNTKVEWDPINIEFLHWLASEFRNDKTMDQLNMNALWDYWKRGNDEEVESNYLSQIDADVVAKDTHGLKTYEECKNDWIYKQNNGIPWVKEKPWTNNEEWTQPMGNICHKCNPLRFKNRTAKWPACNWKEDRYCNTIDLPGLIREGNLIRYEDYEWYNTIEDSELKVEALNIKRILGELINEKEELSDEKRVRDSPIDEWENYRNAASMEADVNSNYNPYLDISRLFNDHTTKNEDKIVQDEMELNNDEDDNMGYLDDHLVRGNAPFIINKKEERFKERRCKPLGIPFTKPPACKTKRFELVKYSCKTKSDHLDDHLVRGNAPFIINKKEERFKERRCKPLGIPFTKPPACKTKRFKLVKYSFGPLKKYVVIKECGYYD